MSLQTEIANALNQMLTGKIHDKERYATDNRKFKAFYAVGKNIDGGFVRRKTRGVQAGDGLGNADEQAFELILVASFDDEADSQRTFETQIDAVIDGFISQSVTANGKTYYCRKGKDRSWRLVKNQPAMFAGVLVHYAVLDASFHSL